MTTIDLRGFDAADKRLASYSGSQLTERLRLPMFLSLEMLKRDMSEYPPPRPAQRYVRTGTLGRAWTKAIIKIDGTSTGLEGRIGNRVPYAPRVQSEEEQGGVFQDRWQTDAEVMNERTRDIRRFFEEALAG